MTPADRARKLRLQSVPFSMRSSPDVIFRALDDGAVLVHLDGNLIYELNATGAHIWQSLAAGQPLDAIARSLVEAFGVDLATASAGTEALVRSLVEAGLVTP